MTMSKQRMEAFIPRDIVRDIGFPCNTLKSAKNLSNENDRYTLQFILKILNSYFFNTLANSASKSSPFYISKNIYEHLSI